MKFARTLAVLLITVGDAVAGDPTPATRLVVGYDEGVGVLECSTCRELPAKTSASSTLTEPKRVYSATLAADASDSTAWCEGVPGVGVGQWIELTLGEPHDIAGIHVVPFYAASHGTMFNNGRVASFEVSIDGRVIGTASIGDADRTPWGTAQLDYPMPWIDFAASKLGPRLPRGTVVRLTITGVNRGDKYEDTCISNVEIHGT